MRVNRVVVVDDSAFMRKFITDLLHSDEDLQVVATAVNGIDAIQKIKELKPDVVTLDIEMPEMDGLTALKIIMQECPCPVVMLSSRTKVGAKATVEALELGAIDFVAKPSGNISLDLDKIQDELVLKVKVAAKAYHRVVKLTPPAPQLQWETTVTDKSSSSSLKAIVAVGCSTGGPRALQTLLSRLPANLPAGIAIVQHMPPGFTKSLAERLNTISQLIVSEAGEGDELLPGHALIAPGDKHMRIIRVGDRFFARLSDEPPVLGLRPSIDKMMESVVECNVPVIGVLLTGMGQDGVIGLKKIQDIRGYTIAEDVSTCIVYGMPRAAVENNCVDMVVPLQSIPQVILDNL